MNQDQKTALTIGGILVAVLIILSVVVGSFWGWQRGSFSMMGPGMMRTTGAVINSEYEYLVHMIPHHEEAILTANILKENTEREEMKQFAEAIISNQSDEIEQMTTWLASWYPDEKEIMI